MKHIKLYEEFFSTENLNRDQLKELIPIADALGLKDPSEIMFIDEEGEEYETMSATITTKGEKVKDLDAFGMTAELWRYNDKLVVLANSFGYGTINIRPEDVEIFDLSGRRTFD